MEETAPPTVQQHGKITGKVVALQVTHFQICPFCNTKTKKCAACSLTVLNTQLQNSTFSKLDIQDKDDDSFLNYIARESVEFSEVEVLKLLSSHSNPNFTLSEHDTLESEISLGH